MSWRSEEDDAVRPIRFALCFPDGAESSDQSADVIGRKRSFINEDDTAVVDSLLGPEPQQRRDGPQVKRHQGECYKATTRKNRCAAAPEGLR